MAAGNVPAATVFEAQRGGDVKLTLDGKAIAELYSAAGTVIRLEDLQIAPPNWKRCWTRRPRPTGRGCMIWSCP